MTERILRFHTAGDPGYLVRYTEAEMDELFSPEQRAALAGGAMLIYGRRPPQSRVIDLEAFFLTTNRWGIDR